MIRPKQVLEHKQVACMPMVSRGGALGDSLDLGTPPILESILPAHHLAFPTTSFPAPVTFWFCILGQCLSQKTLNTEAQSPPRKFNAPHCTVATVASLLVVGSFLPLLPRAQPLVSPLEGIEIHPLVLLLLRFLLLLFKFNLVDSFLSPLLFLCALI